MFQPRAKLEFIRRYCPPSAGWRVFMDIDASEEGRTGGERTTQAAKTRQQQMRQDGQAVRAELDKLGVTVGGSRAGWFRKHGLPTVDGDRDIVAFHPGRKLLVVAEVEGVSSGQPEQKLYKAIGQAVIAAGDTVPNGWTRKLALVTFGDAIATHLRKASALTKLEVSAVALADDPKADQWVFGSKP
ncbi:MAG: hypothetical protein ICCCNLDF_01358 [Planctomycetes bacterium]|nr:hypothetical protein [Planctomycetota bacterium]